MKLTDDEFFVSDYKKREAYVQFQQELSLENNSETGDKKK